MTPFDLVDGLLPEPFVRMAQVAEQFLTARLAQIKRLQLRRTRCRPHAINATARLMPVINRTHVAEARVIPVGHVEAAIWPHPSPHRAEPAVRSAEEVFFVLGAEGGAIRDALADIDEILQRIGRDDLALVGAAEQPALIDRECLREALVVALMAHVLKPAKGVGIGQRAVLAPAFDAVAALLVVHAARGSVGAGEEAAFAVDLQAEGVAAAFRVDFKGLLDGVVAPDALALPFHVLGIGAAHVASGGAAVRAIEPAVHAPLQTSGNAVGVLQAKAAELHLGSVAVRLRIKVGVRIAEQVGRVQHPDASHAMQRGAGDVQAGDHVLVLVKEAVSIRVFKDGDLVCALLPTRRRQGHLVKLGAQVLVVADDLEPGGKLVLAVLHHPHAALGVPAGIKRLLHHGLGGHEVDRHIAARLEFFQGLQRRSGRGVVAHHPASGAGFHDLLHRLIAGDCIGLDVGISGECGTA